MQTSRLIQSVVILSIFGSGLTIVRAEEGPVIEEVVVTAQKRAQSLQDVPAALEAFTGEAIEEAGWRDIQQLQEAVPSLTIGGESKARPFVAIRGVGTRKFDIGTDGSVGVFVDEIYSARFSSLLNGIMDLERIEVLKGPQGTLYGRNTIGGAINIITRQPVDEFEGRVKAGVGDNGFYTVGATVSGPLGDVVRGRLSVARSDLDGIQEDTVSGKDDNSENSGARLSLTMQPSDSWDLGLVVDYAESESDAALTDIEPGTGFPVFLVSPVDPRVPAVVSDGERDRYSNAYGTPGFVDRESMQLAFKAKYSGESVDFLSITSLIDEEYAELRDFDGTILGGYDQRIDQESRQFSQELRLSSVDAGFGTFEGRLTWVAGIYYFEDDAERFDGFDTTPDSIFYFPPLAGAVDTTTFDVDLDTKSYAIYGQATYALTDAWNLTLGLRYTDDEKDFVYAANSVSPIPPVPAPFVVADTLSFDSVDPKLTLDYHVNDDTMLYFTYSSGYKSGGVQYAVGLPEVAQSSFDKEELTNYEVGMKSRWWNQRLQLNASAFHYKYEDQQVQSIVIVNGAPAGLTQNAAESDMNGLELEVSALLTEALTVDFKYAWLDAEFEDFITPTGDFSGNQMPASPEHAFTLSLTHESQFDQAGTLTLNASYSWQDEQYFNFANTPLAVQDDYGLLNLAAWWDFPDGRTRVRVFCQNCADEEYIHNFTAFPDLFGGGRRTWGYERRYGVELSYDF